jgi:hypothetical protein
MNLAPTEGRRVNEAVHLTTQQFPDTLSRVSKRVRMLLYRTLRSGNMDLFDGGSCVTLSGKNICSNMEVTNGSRQ